MLRCRSVAERAGDYLGQALPWPVRVGFSLHLRMCRNCRRFVAQVAQTARLLNEAAPAEVPEELETSLVRSCNKHAAQSRCSQLH